MAELSDTDGDVTSGPVSYRYNFDSIDEYVSTAELVAKDGRLDEAVPQCRIGRERLQSRPDHQRGESIQRR